MYISIIYTLFTLFDISNSQYQIYFSLLYQDKIFYQYSGSEDFIKPSSLTTANFITCTTPQTSYVTLNKNYPSALYYQGQKYSNGDWISIDLYFQGTWSSENVKFTLGSFSLSYIYTSPSSYTMATGFCDTTLFEVKTLNFTLQLAQNYITDYFWLESTNANQGKVSLRNIHISSLTLTCYPSCTLCTGSQYNQCTGCYYGVPTKNICPPCPSNYYYEKNWGCKDICDIYSPLYSKGFCQSYSIITIQDAYMRSPVTSTENLKWQLIYDPEHVDTSPTIQQLVYGVFKFNSGIYRYFNDLTTYPYSTYLIGLKISIMFYNDIPINCGVQFKINNSYYGSIYRNNSGIQTHKCKIYSLYQYGSYLTYSKTLKYDLILFVDIPKSDILFSAIGNYTVNTAGWGISEVQITQGYCSDLCLLCEVSFKCKTCQTGTYFYRDGKCIDSCSHPYQRLNGSYCEDYDDETPYSEYLIQEYIDLAGDPEQYAQYSLISQSGSNLLKGSDIYFSYWQGYRIFGGPFVWAKAKFQRIHNIITPHHSVTIAFYIVYGPSFPSNGKFIYKIENNTPVSKSTTSYFKSYSDGSKEDKVYEKINHNKNTLTITWECFGANNEPIKAYCGFYNYYIAVHNCQPYCLQCSDQSTCTLWNSTYDSSIIKFSQAECLNNQYYDKESVKCLDCPQSCLTCSSKLDCQTCQSTYTQSKLGCICTMHQYEKSNQCFDCPIECNQCLTSTYCIECLTTNNRKFSNGQCICIDGYYPIVSNPQCQLCHQWCRTCIGPSSDECLTCNNIANIEKVGSSCRCSAGKIYQDATQTCESCHYSCLACFGITIDGCLTCDSTLNRELKELKCVCAYGFYELSQVCINCPITEDSSLSQCYKLCDNNQQIWHAFVSEECIPICGDSIIVVGEQCDNSSILPYQGCNNCQVKCQFSCLTCDTTGLGCLLCQIGYNRIDNLCYSICGDNIITEDEQCDDGNLIYGDGCHFCQFSCQDSCLKCLKGICYDCQAGYQLISSKCYSICGDGLQKYKEQCEIITSLQIYQNCQSCQFTCDLNCFECQFGICQKCKEGYELSSNQKYCVKSLQYNFMIIENCGIQIGSSCIKCENYAYFEKAEQKCNLKVAPLSFCQFQLKLSPDLYCSYCFDHCATCNQNNCIDCQNGYYLDENFSCISFCGDGILAHDEQCEIWDKNCLSCMFDVPKLCELYFKDQCFECEYGFYFNQYNNACESQCGDGIIVYDEDCEDNNYIEFDGCYYCKYSCSQYCLNCLEGVCQQCDRHFLLRDGFCYGQQIQIEIFPEYQFNLYAECLIYKEDYQLNEDGNCILKCQESCIHCYNGQCFQCAEQYKLYQNRCILIQQCQIGLYMNYELQICQTSCGDGFITGWEECDDQNMERFDGCFQCKYECDNNCISCIHGECFQCSQEFVLVENICLSKCQEICLNCVQGGCQLCSNGYFLNEYFNCIKIDCEYDFSCTSYCGNGIIEDMEQCDDQNLFNDDDCNNYCEQTCDVNCMHCIDGVCFECKEGWKLDSYFCDPICGDLIVVGNEECDDGNQIRPDGCYQCKLQCTQNCENCLYGICQSCQFDYEFDQSNNLCKPIQPLLTSYEQLNCKLLNNNQCILCQSGYLDQITNICIIDYNMNKCSKNCNECVLSKCLECELGYYGNKCMPKCGDGIIVQEEECDDGGEYQLDACLNCQYQCPQYCNSCAYGICTSCFSGFYLDVISNSCNSICGDNILASDEVCDDGNELEYDGCFQCKYQCQIECLDCQFGKCFLCESPLILVESKSVCEKLKSCEDLIALYYDNYSNDCLPQCGDGIAAGNEQCDDENNVPYDGCYECKFQCTKYCQVCKDSICFECDKDYTLDNNECVLNGEQDDLNSSIFEETQNNETSINNKNSNNAGGNNTSSYGQNPEWSSLNENMICRKTECVYSKKPSMKLTYKLQSFALQYVEITFDQEVKFRDQVEKGKNIFDLRINDLDSQHYNITINSIQDISFDLQYAQYSVQIEIFLQLQTKPVLLVQLNQEIVNSNNQTIVQPNQLILLQAPKIMSKQLKQVSIYAQQSNKAFMIGAITICVISLVSGESSFFVETLNLLQYQSFLRFINVDYPENLEVYFQAQELLSISSYLQFFQIDDYLNLITRKEQQIDLNGKFQQYNIEADLFTNILPQLIQFVALVTLFYFAENLYYILFRLSRYMKYLQYQETLFSKIQFTMIKLILVFKNGIRQLINTKYLQNYDPIIQLIYVNSWDLIFKVILQLHYNQISNLRNILSTFSAGLIFFSFISFLLQSFSLCSNPKEQNFISKLNIKFIALDVFRTTIFHILLILFQEQQILQCLLISISNITYCYIIYQYKQCSCLDRIIFLTIEGVLTLFSLSLFLYVDIDLINLSYKNKVTLGFIQMAFLIMSLGIVFAKQLFMKIKLALRLICEEKEPKFSTSKLFL